MNLLKQNMQKEVQIFEAEIPDVSKIGSPFRCEELVSQKYNRKIRNPFDLEPEEEAPDRTISKERI